MKAIQGMQEKQQENLLRQPLGRYPRLPVKMRLPGSLKAHPSEALQSAVRTHRGLQELLTGIAVTQATVGSLLRRWRIDTSSFIEKIRREESKEESEEEEEEGFSREKCVEEEKREGKRRRRREESTKTLNEERRASSSGGQRLDKTSNRDEEEEAIVKKLQSLLKKIQNRIRNANGVYRHQREMKVEELQEKRDERERRKTIQTLLTSFQ